MTRLSRVRQAKATASMPIQKKQVSSPDGPRPPVAARLYWRAVVRTEGHLDPAHATRPLAWHLVGCTAPTQAEAHCAEGRLLLLVGGDPAGHCLLDGGCARCGETSP